MSDKKLVWDLPLRLFHWLFGLSIIGAWIAIENRAEQIHIYLGYFIIALLLFRLCWGLWGTRHAQFRHFISGPKAVKSYLCALIRGNGRETVGHNPLGSLMVILMFALVGIQAGTGLFLEGDMWSGPYAGTVESSTERLLGSVHEITFNIILTVIVLHVLAVFAYLVVKKQNLIAPMITGKKSGELVPEGEHIRSSRLWLALITLLVVGGFVYWLVFVAPPPPPAMEEYLDFY